jgi:hypothetical protein
MAYFHSPQIVKDGLVLLLDAANTKSYPGSGTTWFDKSGNGNNGTLTNGPTFSSDNLGSIVFDGVNDYISITTSQLRFGNSDQYTLDFFVKLPHSTSNRTIFSNGNLSTPGNGIWFFKRRSGLDNKLTFHGFSTNPRIDLVSTNILPDNQFCSVSLTFDGVSNYTIYINGQVENTLSTNQISPATGNSFIAATEIGPANFLEGDVYSAKIYNRALSEAEIFQNYNATKGRFGL